MSWYEVPTVCDVSSSGLLTSLAEVTKAMTSSGSAQCFGVER